MTTPATGPTAVSSRDRILAEIEKGQQLAGHQPSASALARATRVLDGEITLEEAHREIRDGLGHKDREGPQTIGCHNIDALIEAQERDEPVVVKHVCENALRHAGPLDNLSDRLAAGDPADEAPRQASGGDTQ